MLIIFRCADLTAKSKIYLKYIYKGCLDFDNLYFLTF